MTKPLVKYPIHERGFEMKPLRPAPMCHFTHMEYCAGESDDLGRYEEWFECKHCGCQKDWDGRVYYDK